MTTMLYASFGVLADALAHRNLHGGWIFVPVNEPEWIWFHPQFTPSTICNHRVTRGLEGLIGCTEAQLTR